MTSLILGLQNARLYPHPIDSFQMVETHISQVLLTGQFVYKIKKPVNFGFLDFSSLEKRRYYCEEELRLNRRLAPELYIGLVEIKGSESDPRLDGEGEVIEYAIKMRQFPQQAQLDEMLAAGQLNDEIIDRLADKLARFHSSISAAERESLFGDVEHIRQPVMENFLQIRETVDDSKLLNILHELEQWTLRQLNELAPLIQSRKENGYVRECHGDMHLRNIAWWNNEILIFDCIEFNPNFYWIDVMSEIAFLLMDLEARNQPALAQRFLNRYLESSGDFDGMPLLRFYKVYRAMVRAKVDALRMSQQDRTSDEYRQCDEGFRQYLHLAQDYLKPSRPIILINYGLSGAGKSVISRQLAEGLPAILIRSDIERKRLYRVPLKGQSSLQQRQQLYTKQATEKTYARLHDFAVLLLKTGCSVIIDAANLKIDSRQMFVEIAKSLHVSYLILWFNASEQVLRERIELRAQAGNDVSDATLQVLEQQISSVEPISETELGYTLEINTEQVPSIPELIQQIKRRVEP